MNIAQALRACRRTPDDLQAAQALLQHFEASLEQAAEEWIAIEALEAMRQERKRIQDMEQELQRARIQVLEAVTALPMTESEIVAAFYLGRMSIAQISLARRCNERYVKRCKARAVSRMAGAKTARKGSGRHGQKL